MTQPVFGLCAPFCNDIYLLAGGLRRQNDFQVIKEKDDVLHPKANSYHSYHFLVQVVLLAELKRCADEMAPTDSTMQAIQEVLDLHNGACLALDRALVCQ